MTKDHPSFKTAVDFWGGLSYGILLHTGLGQKKEGVGPKLSTHRNLAHSHTNQDQNTNLLYAKVSSLKACNEQMSAGRLDRPLFLQKEHPFNSSTMKASGPHGVFFMSCHAFYTFKPSAVNEPSVNGSMHYRTVI